MTQFERRTSDGRIKEVRIMGVGYTDDIEEQARHVQKMVDAKIKKSKHDDLAELDAFIAKAKKGSIY